MCLTIKPRHQQTATETVELHLETTVFHVYLFHAFLSIDHYKKKEKSLKHGAARAALSQAVIAVEEILEIVN